MRVDPVGEGLNLYLYVQNNPLKYIDPRGLTTRSYQNTTSYQQPAYTHTQSVSVTSNNQLDLGVPGGGPLYAETGMTDFDYTSSPTSNSQIEMGMPGGGPLYASGSLVDIFKGVSPIYDAWQVTKQVIEANGIPEADAWLDPFIESERESIEVQDHQDMFQELLDDNARDIPTDKWLDMMKRLPDDMKESGSTIKTTANEQKLWGGR